MVGSGVFLLFGAIARRGAAAGLGGDPVPQALLITGIVVAFSATALAVAVLLRLFAVTGTVTLAADAPAKPDADTSAPAEEARERRSQAASAKAGTQRRATEDTGSPPSRERRIGLRVAWSP